MHVGVIPDLTAIPRPHVLALAVTVVTGQGLLARLEHALSVRQDILITGFGCLRIFLPERTFNPVSVSSLKALTVTAAVVQTAEDVLTAEAGEALDEAASVGSSMRREGGGRKEGGRREAGGRREGGEGKKYNIVAVMTLSQSSASPKQARFASSPCRRSNLLLTPLLPTFLHSHFPVSSLQVPLALPLHPYMHGEADRVATLAAVSAATLASALSLAARTAALAASSFRSCLIMLSNNASFLLVRAK